MLLTLISIDGAQFIMNYRNIGGSALVRTPQKYLHSNSFD